MTTEKVAKPRRSRRRRLILAKLPQPKPCSSCGQLSELGTAGGRALHPCCSIGFEMFHPEAGMSRDEAEAALEVLLVALGGRIVRVEEHQ